MKKLNVPWLYSKFTRSLIHEIQAGNAKRKTFIRQIQDSTPTEEMLYPIEKPAPIPENHLGLFEEAPSSSDGLTQQVLDSPPLTSSDITIIVPPPSTSGLFEEASPQAGDGGTRLAYTMPQAEYMYGCTATAVGMLIGYYDRFGYMGYDVSNLIDGEIELNARGLDGNPFDMDAFDTRLGRVIASERHVSEFYGKSTSVEYQNTFVSGSLVFDTSRWDSLADYMGTNQFWRGNPDLGSTYYYSATVAQLQATEQVATITGKNAENTQITMTIPLVASDFLCGLALYFENAGYSINANTSGHFEIDAHGGDFTFADYKAEIDAGRGVILEMEGHSVVGYGYDAATQEVIFDDTYQTNQRMHWNGTYHYAGEDRSLIAATIINFNTNGLNSFGQSGTSDFAGDGKSDLLFTGGAENECWIWQNGDAVQSIQNGNYSASYKIVGIGDFSGDGRADVLWRDTVGNTVGVWKNGQANQWQDVAQVAHNVGEVVGIGDFNADGKDDILWEIQDGTIGYWSGDSTEWHVIGATSSPWKIVAVGDFDGNGCSDIMWQNGTAAGIWMNGTNQWTSSTLVANEQWRVIDVGRFDADSSRESVLWFNETTGKTGYWTLGGNNQMQWTDQMTGGANWKAVGTSDFDGDRLSDVIWQNEITGEYGYWAAGNDSWHSMGTAPDGYKAAIAIA